MPVSLLRLETLMLLWCNHRVPWIRTCPACVEEEMSRDPISLGEAIEVHAHMHECLDNCFAKGLLDPAKHPRPKDAVELGIELWLSAAFHWYERHGRDAEFGGES